MEYKNLIIAGIASLLLTVVAMPFYIKWLLKVKAGQSIREDGPDSHMVKSGTPTMGGLIIIAGIIVGTLLVGEFTGETFVPLLALILFGALGFLDDFVKVSMKRNLGLTAKQKLLLQIILALGLALYGTGGQLKGSLWIPVWNYDLDMGIFYLPFIIFVVVAMVNSVNLTDGLDGLAAGTSAIIAASFAAIAVGAGYMGAAGFSAAVFGALIGFLVFNRYPAKIFMGDTGSLALGGGLAGCAIIMGKELLLPIAGGIFVLEALSVIIQVVSFKTRGKRVFKMAPLHHHFELSGWKETKVVIVFYIVTAVLSALAIYMA